MVGDEGRQRVLSIFFLMPFPLRKEKRVMYAKIMKMGRNAIIVSIDLTVK